jgi:HSP20 family protein
MTLPGYKKNELSIDIINNMLVITGENKRNTSNYTRESISYGKFTQKFTLPDNVSGSINAKLEDGILKITIPKSEKGTSRIKID